MRTTENIFHYHFIVYLCCGGRVSDPLSLPLARSVCATTALIRVYRLDENIRAHLQRYLMAVIGYGRLATSNTRRIYVSDRLATRLGFFFVHISYLFGSPLDISYNFSVSFRQIYTSQYDEVARVIAIRTEAVQWVCVMCVCVFGPFEFEYRKYNNNNHHHIARSTNYDRRRTRIAE